MSAQRKNIWIHGRYTEDWTHAEYSCVMLNRSTMLITHNRPLHYSPSSTHDGTRLETETLLVLTSKQELQGLHEHAHNTIELVAMTPDVVSCKVCGWQALRPDEPSSPAERTHLSGECEYFASGRVAAKLAVGEVARGDCVAIEADSCNNAGGDLQTTHSKRFTSWWNTSILTSTLIRAGCTDFDHHISDPL